MTAATREPFYRDDAVVLHHGDCLDVMLSLPDCSVDAVVTDPPYGLEFMGKDWDAPWAARTGLGGNTAGMSTVGLTDGATRLPRPSYLGSQNPTCRNCGGLRSGSDTKKGQKACRCDAPKFDNVTLPRMQAFQVWCEQWAAECLRVLKPGGHMLAFGGSRTWHRLAVAVEDAGFELRDSIAWLYGSGFPKSLDVSKAIDKRPGVTLHAAFAGHLAAKREAAGLSRADVSERVVGTRSGACWNWEHHQFPEAKWWPALRALLDLDDSWTDVVAEAERTKVGTRTTGIGTGHGAVPLMGDGHRDITASTTEAGIRWQGWGTALKPAFEPIVVGRKPLAGTVAANVLQHGTGTLNIDGCRVGAQESLVRPAIERRDNVVLGAGLGIGRQDEPAGRWPPNAVLDEQAAAELDRQTGVSRSRVGKPRGAAAGDGWGMTATGAEYDDQGGASRFFPTFRYEAKAGSAERPKYWRHACDCPHDVPMRPKGSCGVCGVPGELVAHPTVKPLGLIRWLVRLVTPPGGTVLDLFAGSGTTGEACVLEGFECVLVEGEADYLPLIVQRLSKPLQPGLGFEVG